MKLTGALHGSYECIGVQAVLEDCIDQLAILGHILPSTTSYQENKSARVSPPFYSNYIREFGTACVDVVNLSLMVMRLIMETTFTNASRFTATLNVKSHVYSSIVAVLLIRKGKSFVL